VSVADARSKLSAIATMQIPIVWDGGEIIHFYNVRSPTTILAYPIWGKPPSFH
jgi:hypothetical protein